MLGLLGHASKSVVVILICHELVQLYIGMHMGKGKMIDYMAAIAIIVRVYHVVSWKCNVQPSSSYSLVVFKPSWHVICTSLTKS